MKSQSKIVEPKPATDKPDEKEMQKAYLAGQQLSGETEDEFDNNKNELIAKLNSCNIRLTVLLYMAQNSGKCPSIDYLKNGYIDSPKRIIDPWGNKFVIECNSYDVAVYSKGKMAVIDLHAKRITKNNFVKRMLSTLCLTKA